MGRPGPARGGPAPSNFCSQNCEERNATCVAFRAGTRIEAVRPAEIAAPVAWGAPAQREGVPLRAIFARKIARKETPPAWRFVRGLESRPLDRPRSPPR